MASLLDVMIAKRNPQLGGLLGVETEQPSASAGVLQSGGGSTAGGGASGGQGFISRVLGGANDPRLSEEANARAGRQAQLMSALGMLAADPNSGLRGLAQGALVGQQVGAQAREQAVEAGERAREVALQAEIGQLFGGNTEDVRREDAERALQLAISAGELDTAKSIQDFINSLPGEPEPHKPETVKLADGTTAVFDPNERTFYNAAGEVLTELPENVAKNDDKLQFVQGVDPNTGKPVSGVINLDQSTFTPVEGVVDGSSLKSQKFSPDAIQAAEQATKARANLNTVRSYLQNRIEENPKNPLRGIRFDRARFEQTGLLVPFAQRQRLDTETQEFLQAQEAFMIQLANKLAGVRGVSSESARGAIFRTFGFEEGDSPENIRNTLRELEIGVKSLELQAGDALGLFSQFDLDEEEEDNPFNSARQ